MINLNLNLCHLIINPLNHIIPGDGGSKTNIEYYTGLGTWIFKNSKFCMNFDIFIPAILIAPNNFFMGPDQVLVSSTDHQCHK